MISYGHFSDIMSDIYHRMHGMDTYSIRLYEADSELKVTIEQISGDIRWTYRMIIWMHLLSYAVGAIALVVGFFLVLVVGKPELYPIGYAGIIGGLITTVFLLTRNPMKNARYLVTNSAKLAFASSSYMRQMHLVDTTFKQLLGNGDEITSDELEKMFKMTQDAVDEVLNTISQILNDIDD